MNINIHIHKSFSKKQFKKLMASNEELNAKLDTLQQTVDTVQQQLIDANTAKDALIAQQAASIDTLNAAKDALTAELANSVSPEQTQAAIAKIDATIADISSTTAPAPVV